MEKTSWHTHTQPFNDPLSGTTQVSRYHKAKTSLDFTEATDSEWQWHQLGHMQICTSLQTDNHASTPPLSFYRPDALPAAQPTASKHWSHKKCPAKSRFSGKNYFLPRDAMHPRYSPWACVCLSVTSRSSTKTAKRRITQTTPHDTPGTLVFWCQRSPQNSTGVTPYGGTKCRWGGSKSATFDK